MNINLVILVGAVVGNMALIFGLLMRPRNPALLWLGLGAYVIASAAWLLRRRSDRQ
jgi:hypothetical protein